MQRTYARTEHTKVQFSGCYSIGSVRRLFDSSSYFVVYNKDSSEGEHSISDKRIFIRNFQKIVHLLVKFDGKSKYQHVSLDPNVLNKLNIDD